MCGSHFVLPNFVDCVYDYIKLFLAFDKIIPYLSHFLLFINAQIFRICSAITNSELYIDFGILRKGGDYATLIHILF